MTEIANIKTSNEGIQQYAVTILIVLALTGGSIPPIEFTGIPYNDDRCISRIA